MIYNALIVPTERPSTLREIKRALLTYDQILLVDPSDRDLFPPQAFFSALMGMPLFGMNMGPVRAMGKLIGYDSNFEKIIDECKLAISQNSIKIISTYNSSDSESVTIGGVPLGGYPLNIQAVFGFYRALASSQDLLTDVIGHDISALRHELLVSQDIASAGGADFSINDIPALPIASIVANDSLAEPLTQIARARIAAIIKYSGFCEAKNLVPIFGASFYIRALERILCRAQEFLDAGSAGNQFHRSRVLSLAHEEFLVDERLDTLSIEDVLRLRTAAWGRQAASRERLFEAIFEIADSSRKEGEFFEIAKSKIRDYRRESDALVRERESLSMKIKCEIGIGALVGGVGAAGLISQIESPLQSIGVTLAAGGVWALEKAKEYVPKLHEIQYKTNELKRGAGFAFHNFYTRLSK